MVNYDVDAICAVKILQNVLRFDNIIYVLVPVKTITEFKKAFEEQNVDVNFTSDSGCLIDIIHTYMIKLFFLGKTYNINKLWWYI